MLPGGTPPLLGGVGVPEPLLGTGVTPGGAPLPAGTGVFVAVAVGVTPAAVVAVAVGIGVSVGVTPAVGVSVGVTPTVGVTVGVITAVGVGEGVTTVVGVLVGVITIVSVIIGEGVVPLRLLLAYALCVGASMLITENTSNVRQNANATLLITMLLCPDFMRKRRFPPCVVASGRSGVFTCSRSKGQKMPHMC